MSNALTTSDVARDLGLSLRVIQSYIKQGFLPAALTFVGNRKLYQIDNSEYLEWKNKQFKGLKRGSMNRYTRLTRELTKPQLISMIDDWVDWCKSGKLIGKPMSQVTVKHYEYFANRYFELLSQYASKPLISVNNLRDILGSYKPENYSTKRNIFLALMSFSLYLVETGKMKASDREALKKLKPKRFLPPKRTSLSESELKEVLEHINCSNSNQYDKLLNKSLVVFMANTGLRAAEVCRLKLEDVDLENRIIYVKNGKNQKSRKVGITSELNLVLVEYLKARFKFGFESFFLNGFCEPFSREVLTRRMCRLFQRANFKNIGCHSLRRSFASINSAKGKPLNHLRISLGHSHISTTQSYLTTSEDEVVEAMRGW